MSCPACGRDNRPGARFCADCGAAQAARCAACQAELPAGARFCDDCGTPVASGTSGAQTRRVVTVLFADLAGSTSIQETLDPESVRHLMDRFNRAMSAAVEHHAGTVVKYTGDGLMAAFGVRAVAEDDAWRAVQTAVAMQEAFASLGWDPDIALRVGVNTGEVIVTEGESDVVGDSVNVAARLESAAGPGGVLVGEETWRLTRHRARFQAVAPLTLKGKTEPVPAYGLVALGEDVVDAPAPFVGRDDELARLVSLFEEARGEGAVRLATVIGSPGLGKSRLATELVATLADRATVLEARFSATTAAATFAPVVDALREAVGDDEVGDVVSASPQEAFLAVRRSVETLAAERAVVLVLEDLHWAGPLVLDLVEHLVEWTQHAAVLLLALARPELREQRPALVETGGRASLVTVLEGLDAAASERLACDLLETDELPPALLSRILTASEGNPLFVRELVRMLVDDGVLRRHGDRWRPTIEVDAITVPPTIQSLLAARVERLPADERTVLECAAVVGREFYRGAVVELLPAAVRPAIDVILERLRQKEMVEPEGTYSVDEPILRFNHVLLRDAAYRRLLKEVRAELHERYARWLEAKAGDGDDNDEVLGYHFEQAHQYRVELGTFDEHTSALGRRAAERLASAGRRALDRDDLPAAAGLLGRALKRVDGDDPDRPGLLIDRCEALLSTGAVADGGLAVAELEALADGSPRLRAWATCFAAQLAILTDPGHLQETAALVEHAAAELAKLADAAGAAKAHAVHASALARLGRVAETEAALDRALAAAREAGDTRRATGVLAGAPVAALWGPSPVARASGRCLDVVRVLRITTSATTVEATSLRCQAVLEALRGRTDAGRRMLASARRSLEELGHRHGLLSTDMFAGLVELLADDPSAAEHPLHRAHEGFLELGADADAGQAAALLARAVMAQGRTAEAEQLTVESERLGGADLKTAIAWRAVRAEALARRGSVDEALELARAAVALAEPTDALLDQADTHLAMATVLQLAGRGEEAAASAAHAVDLYERKGASVPADRARSLVVTPSAAAPERAPEVERRRRFRPNTVTIACEHAVRAFNTGDMQAYVALFAPDATLLDHVHSTDGEPYKMTVGWASFQVPEDAQITVEPVLPMGSRHALVRGRTPLTSDLAGPAEVDELRVMRVGSDGRFVLQERFRPDQLHLALARLLEMHAEDEMEGAEQAASIRLAQICRLLCPGGWDEMARESYAADGVLVDHRAVVNFGTVRGLDAILSAFDEMDQVAGPMSARLVDVLAGTPTGGLLELTVESRPSGSFEFQFLVIAMAGPDGLLELTEWFELDQLDAAHARFEELDVASAWEGLSNATVVAIRRFVAHRNDWAHAAEELSPAIEIHDHRMAIQGELRGAAAVENIRLIVTTPGHVRIEPLAVRGQRLALCTTTFTDAAYETEVLGLYETDQDGRAVRLESFDVSDLESAFVRLHARHAAGEGAPFQRVLDAVEGFAAGVRAHDPEAISAGFAADAQIIDHRPVGWGEVGRDEYRRLLGSLFSLTPDFRAFVTEILRLSDGGAVFTLQGAGTQEPGARVEIATCQLVLVTDGFIVRHEHFPIDAVDSALARFDELTTPPAAPSNSALDVERRLNAAVAAHDWSAAADLLRPDFVIEDRRAALQSSGRGREAFIASSKAMGDVSAITETAVSTRGDHLSLARVLMVGEEGHGGHFEVGFLVVFEVDDAGLATRLVAFDEGDLAEARAELEERYRASEGVAPSDPALPATAATAAGDRFLAAWSARDVNGMTAAFSADATWDDRRYQIVLRGRAEIGRAVALMADVHTTEVTILATRGERLCLGLGRWAGGGSADEAFDLESVQIIELDFDGLFHALVQFDPADLDAAFDELDRRFVEGEAALYVGAWNRFVGSMTAYNAGDAEGLAAAAAGLSELIDHRTLGWGRSDDADFEQAFRASVDDTSRMVCRAVPRIGAHGILAVMETGGAVPMGGGQWEQHFVALMAFRGDQPQRLEFFAVEQLDAAIARFDELTS